MTPEEFKKAYKLYTFSRFADAHIERSTIVVPGYNVIIERNLGQFVLRLEKKNGP